MRLLGVVCGWLRFVLQTLVLGLAVWGDQRSVYQQNHNFENKKERNTLRADAARYSNISESHSFLFGGTNAHFPSTPRHKDI